MATIKEIAKACNVSIATVSNILNGKPGASEATRSLVLKTVEKMDYTPNYVAKNLKMKNTRSIGVIAEDMTIFSIPDIIDGITEYCQEIDYQILLTNMRLFKKYNDTADGRIKIWFGLRTIFNNSDELIKGTKTLADKYNTGIHMHVLEVKEEMDYTRATRGETTVEHMNRLGALGPNLVAAHTVWLTEREIDLFRLYDVKVSHNPGAAMKVVLGFAKIPEMLEKGIAVSIGTDGAPSNNRMDMMRDMYLTSLIHKGRTLNPKTVSAEQVLEMATINGARCALMEKEIGSLEVGKKADLIILNPDTIHSLPVIDPVANIVYAMSSENVESNMCNGKWLMKNREILFLDEKDLLEKVKIQNKKVMDKAGIVIPDRFPVIEIK